MASPFPGMNPYLEHEDIWQDFHQSFLPMAREFLSEQVRPAYFVKVEEHLFVHEAPADQRWPAGRADVSLTRSPHAESPAAGAILEAPFYATLLPDADVERQSYLEIRDRLTREVVTIIELLSPANKRPGPDRASYLSKRMRLLISQVNLVEIDLLRGGPRLPVENLPACDYYTIVSRIEERPRAGTWPIHLRDRLPIIPIPLRSPDADAKLDLQQILSRVYDAAGYEDYIYSNNLLPALSPADSSWAKQFIPSSSR